MAANIPLNKLSNPTLKIFLQKYTGRNVPDESTLRKYYVSRCYTRTVERIRSHLLNQYIWISADETVDMLGRCVVNVVAGVLHPTIPYNSYVIATSVINRVDAETVAETIKENMQKMLHSDATYKEKILLFVSDSAAYMLKTGRLLKKTYPNMLHITCVAHALHRICEYIRDTFPEVDRLVSAFKKVFRKAPLRVALFREKFPSLSLPPTPVITRWGTWLEATSYYAENFDSLKHFVTLLKEDARSIGECKELTQIPNLKNQLYFLHEHFGKLPKLITYFENRNLKLNDGLTTLDVAVNNLKSIPSDFGCGLRQKFEAILNRNPDLITLQQLCMETIPQNLTAKYEEIKEYFQYAPITSCDVERTFSIYKDVLNSKRTKLTEENLEKLLLVNINTPLLNLNDKMNK